VSGGCSLCLRKSDMIKNLAVHNFRCFRKTKFIGFNTVNLIGGKNNSGKTALLEALFLNISPRAKTVLSLRRFRQESLEFAKNMPERAWSNLFYDGNIDEPLKIISYDEKDSEYHHVEISCSQSSGFDENFIEKETDDERNSLSETDARSGLDIKLVKKDKSHNISSLVAHSKGILTKDSKITDEKKVNYIPAAMRFSGEALAREYDKAEIKGNAAKVLKLLQIIDKSIAEIKTFSIGEPAIYLKRLNKGDYLPISLYGEAVFKLTDFILRIINEPDSVLLIDEIENGIHYTNQYGLWKMIFELSSVFKVQIFATTHSHEMIQAFVNAGLSDDASKEKASYFEIAENIKSGELIGIKRDLETLKYEMSQGMGFRGE
jgi:predicted ATP-dependent endonuclease of OLD family